MFSTLIAGVPLPPWDRELFQAMQDVLLGLPQPARADQAVGRTTRTSACPPTSCWSCRSATASRPWPHLVLLAFRRDSSSVCLATQPEHANHRRFREPQLPRGDGAALLAS